jgi:hypothetical protein
MDDSDEGKEDRETVLTRHRKEVRDLETKSRFTLKQAKNKTKKAEAEAEVSNITRMCRQRRLLAMYSACNHVCSVC